MTVRYIVRALWSVVGKQNSIIYLATSKPLFCEKGFLVNSGTKGHACIITDSGPRRELMNTWMARRRLSWTNVTLQVERDFAACWWVGVGPSMPFAFILVWIQFTMLTGLWFLLHRSYSSALLWSQDNDIVDRIVKSLSLVCKLIISPAFFSYPECPPGSYKTTVGNGACLSCPGKTEVNNNRTACDCKDGFYRASGETAEQACTSKSSSSTLTHDFEVHSMLDFSSRLHSNRECNVESGFVLRIIPSLKYFTAVLTSSASCFQPSQALQQIPKRRLSVLPRWISAGHQGAMVDAQTCTMKSATKEGVRSAVVTAQQRTGSLEQHPSLPTSSKR